ncbi:MAG TPA: L,D-transpeptidase family protein [Flavisolibacter sp.]
MFLFVAGSFLSCKEPRVNIEEKTVVETPEEINTKAEDVIQGTLKAIEAGDKSISDSVRVRHAGILYALYEKNSFRPLWSTEGTFISVVDSFLLLTDSAMLYGLFPEDYNQQRIRQLHTLLATDTSRETHLDVSRWAYTDLLLTSAFVQMVRDIKSGRLLPDSILNRDSIVTIDFLAEKLEAFRKTPVYEFAASLEPANTDYHRLREALPAFLRKADMRRYTRVVSRDSSRIPALVYQRISEEDTLDITASPDSLQVASAVKRYQKRKKLKADGKITAGLIDRLNNTDREKFIRIAITLDRFKMMPPLPVQYIWVNIPGYYLQVRDSDSVVLQSKVVVGKPETKTPIITSAISDMITYPKWHIPESIIKKEILPGLKKDPGYTVRRGYSLLDSKGNEIDPYTVQWAKYTSSIPYRVVQGSGDDNALGVLKFNFPNKFAVYLHDTNQRYLFSRSARSLSHGCVRVQSWLELAKFILHNDSLAVQTALPVDSLNAWLERKEKHVIPVRKRIPLYIRYVTCDAKDGKVIFYEDIYGEDRKLRDKIFHGK